VRYRASVGNAAARPLAILAALAVLLALAVTGMLIPAAGAQEGQALLRVAHLSVDADPVDVYVDGESAVTGLEFRSASQYMELTPGEHEVAVRPAGSAPGAAPLADLIITTAASSASTVGLFGPEGVFALAAFTDDLSAPPSGQAKVRGIHAGVRTNANAVDVFANGQRLFTNLSYQTATEYLTLPGGTIEVEVRAAGTETVLISAGQVNVPAGAVITFAGVGSGDSGYEFVPLLDAAGAGTAPVGGVDTGAGGTAPLDLPVQALIATGTLIAAVTLAGLLRGRRRAAWRGEATRG